jgi:TonB family protein
MKNSVKQQGAYRIAVNLIPLLLIVVAIFCSCRHSTKESSPSSLNKNPGSIVDSIYTEVDSLPVFAGGDQALLKFIAENTAYPEEAMKKNITGKVLVRFVVRKDGTVSDVTLAKGVDPLIDSEALRVIGKLPRFEKPGITKGEIVSVYYIVPITFALK